MRSFKGMILVIGVFLTQLALAIEPVIIVVGPPGSGKGNFSQYFMEKFHYNHLSAGDLLRQEIDRKTEIGLQIEETFRRGEPVAPQTMRALMTQEIVGLEAQKKPFIVDGFGGQDKGDMQFLYQTLSDLHLLDRALVVFFDAEDSTCQNRMSGRLVCSQCAYIHNLNTLPPQEEGKCDACQGQLIQRAQDTPETIVKRLAGYRQRMEPNYKQALSLFPSLFYRTDGDLESCSEYYQKLGEEISQFEGSVEDFLKSAGRTE